MRFGLMSADVTVKETFLSATGVEVDGVGCVCMYSAAAASRAAVSIAALLCLRFGFAGTTERGVRARAFFALRAAELSG